MTSAHHNQGCGRRSRSATLGLVILAMIGLALASSQSANAQTFTTLFSFCYPTNYYCSNNGLNPYAALLQGSDGNLYGTTAYAGGTVFKITPSGSLSTLYYFCSQSNCADGYEPLAALVQGSDGNFYGTTYSGGASGDHLYGTVFRLSPIGQFATVYSFCSQGGACTDGVNPSAALVQGTDGKLYGTTSAGGSNGDGTVFKITPSGLLTTLYSFCSQANCADGENPWAALVEGSDGNFYGTTKSGGVYQSFGTVFKITPSGTLATLYKFCSQSNCTDGAVPYAGLVQGVDGNFYGTTSGGGSNGEGTVFKITPSGTLTTLYSFCSQSNCTDGINPYASLVQGVDGNFYGTTYGGGANGTYDGTVFGITPSGTLTTLYSFCSQSNCADGQNPQAGLVQGRDGNLYGTTYYGGGHGYGEVFKLTLPPGETSASVSPTSLTFPGQLIGTSSPPQAVTLSNTGNATLTVSSIVASGDFAETDNCNGPLTAGSSCTINVTFTPSAAGSRKGTLAINDNASGSPQTIIVTGVGAAASLSPNSINFGNQAVGSSSAPQTVTLSNASNAVMNIWQIAVRGTNAGDFSKTTTCGSTLPPQPAYCTISVTFTPSGTGARAASLLISNDGGGSPQAVSLSGNGTMSDSKTEAPKLHRPAHSQRPAESPLTVRERD